MFIYLLNNIYTIHGINTYYDVETGLYYVSSRYYDPEVCRFINADVFVSTGQGFVGNNMFAYCGNNAVNRVDLYGYYYWECTDFNNFTPRDANILFSKKRTNRPDTGLIGVSNEEVSQKARDKSLSGKERQRYLEEEKIRGLRNRQKRGVLKSEPVPVATPAPIPVATPIPQLAPEPAPAPDAYYDPSGRSGISEGFGKVLEGGAVAVGGYFIYRVIRLLPSLAPPLWWTAPGNLVTP